MKELTFIQISNLVFERTWEDGGVDKFQMFPILYTYHHYFMLPILLFIIHIFFFLCSKNADYV